MFFDRTPNRVQQVCANAVLAVIDPFHPELHQDIDARVTESCNLGVWTLLGRNVGATDDLGVRGAERADVIEQQIQIGSVGNLKIE